jgi:hypothetical protein
MENKIKNKYEKDWFGIVSLGRMELSQLQNILKNKNLFVENQHIDCESCIQTLDDFGYVKSFKGRGRKEKNIKIEDVISLLRKMIKKDSLHEKIEDGQEVTITLNKKLFL